MDIWTIVHEKSQLPENIAYICQQAKNTTMKRAAPDNDYSLLLSSTQETARPQHVQQRIQRQRPLRHPPGPRMPRLHQPQTRLHVLPLQPRRNPPLRIHRRLPRLENHAEHKVLHRRPTVLHIPPRLWKFLPHIQQCGKKDSEFLLGSGLERVGTIGRYEGPK